MAFTKLREDDTDSIFKISYSETWICKEAVM